MQIPIPFGCAVTHPTKLHLSSGQPVETLPGSKPATSVVCQRIRICGQPRLGNLGKYAYALKVKVNATQANSRTLEVCFHRNESLLLGMCPQNDWMKLSKGSWVQLMSPYDSKLLDIRVPGKSLGFVEVSSEEEFRMYRVVFLVLGIVLMTLAPMLSKSVVFYYGSAMTIGIILVILMVLFQIGVGSFLLSYLSGLLRSVLVQMGISEDMYSPVAIFFLLSLVLAGAWLGFWGVRKLILTEEGSVDLSVAHFVSWSIWIFAAVMILQSSLDALLAAEALISGIIISFVTRKIGNSRFLLCLFKESPFRRADSDVYDVEYMRELRRSKAEVVKPRTRPFTLASCTSPAQGSFKRPPDHPSWEPDAYYSTFHKTPERKKFSKDEWDTFTKDSTRKALEGLVSSPDFTRWAVANADRITLTPTDSSKTKEQRQAWFSWF
ncbi:hypothetical protein ACLOJK_003463 [Asimina triloba]